MMPYLTAMGVPPRTTSARGGGPRGSLSVPLACTARRGGGEAVYPDEDRLVAAHAGQVDDVPLVRARRGGRGGWGRGARCGRGGRCIVLTGQDAHVDQVALVRTEGGGGRGRRAEAETTLERFHHRR